MAQYLDQAGLNELVKKTKEYARKSAKEAVNTSAASASKTITGWNDGTSAAIYSPIAITSAQVTDLADAMALKADLDSPHFTGTPTVPYPTDTSTESSAVANVKYVLDTVGTLAEAMLYKGAVDGSTKVLPTTGYKAGWTYKVATAGTYAGQKCEVGDLIIANKDYVSGATASDDWDVIQTNIDGAVTGPSSSTDGNFVLFNGSTGKIIKNSDVSPASFKRIQTSASFDGDDLKTVQKISQNANGEISVSFQDIQSATTEQKGVVQLAGSIGATVSSENNKAATEKAVRDAINDLDAEISSFDGKNVNVKVTEVDGKITAVNIIKDTTVNSGYVSTMITSAINNLDVSPITSDSGAAATITSISETDGKIAATYSPIAITSAQVTNLSQTLSDAISSVIDDLDVTASAIPTSGTITSISETNGKIAITSGAIAIKTSQITDFQDVLNTKADKVTDATSGNFAMLDGNGNLKDLGYGYDTFKKTQTAVTDPTATSSAYSFIDSISQDTNGVITPTKKNLPYASTTADGLMSASDFRKLAGITSGANHVEVDDSGNLKIDGVAKMTPITINEIDNLFVGN